jgi:hypothetical protein
MVSLLRLLPSLFLTLLLLYHRLIETGCGRSQRCVSDASGVTQVHPAGERRPAG